MIKDFETLKEKANALKNSRLINHNVTGVGTYSFNIVNNKNGKRISFSKALSVKLGLEGTVDMIALEDEGVILISKNLPYDTKSTYELRGDDKKIIYNSELVQNLTEIFDLDFSTKTSCSFTDITVNADDNMLMAAIKITKTSKDT